MAANVLTENQTLSPSGHGLAGLCSLGLSSFKAMQNILKADEILALVNPKKRANYYYYSQVRGVLLGLLYYSDYEWPGKTVYEVSRDAQLICDRLYNELIMLPVKPTARMFINPSAGSAGLTEVATDLDQFTISHVSEL